MKLSIAQQPKAQTTGIQGKEFALKLDAKMYDILLNKMYQNKSGAILRELSCNAYDSHVAKGCPEKPFEIHMPSWLDQNFGIRDFGTGIPHDQFEDIYNHIGKSTKDESNDYIGSFGLGNKSVFTLADSVIIENWYGGRKSTWVNYMNGGVPTSDMISIESSDEPSGLQVSFAFEDRDSVREFQKEIKEQLKFFPVKPKITGEDTQSIKWPKLPVVPQGQNYYFIKEEDGFRYNTKHYVVMGNVSYPFTSRDADLQGSYNLSSLFESGESLVILAALGDVDIPPSREQLELTPKTKAFLKKTCEDIMKSYVDQFLKDMGTQSTHLSALKYVYNSNKRLVSQALRQSNPEFNFLNGETAKWNDLSPHGISDSAYSAFTIHTRYKNVLRSSTLSIPALAQDKVDFYVYDLEQGGITHLNIEAGQVTTTSPVNTAYIIKPQGSYNKKTFSDDVSECVKYIEKKYGKKPVLLSSIIGHPPANIKVSKKYVEPNQIFIAKSNSDTTRSLQSFGNTYTEKDYPTTGYYIEISGWSEAVTPSSLGSSRVKQLLKTMLERTTEKVYLVRSKTVPKLPKTLKPFGELVKQWEIVTLKDVERTSYIQKVQSALGDCLSHTSTILEVNFKNKEYRTLQRYLRNLQKVPLSSSDAEWKYRIVHDKSYVEDKGSTLSIQVVPSKLPLLNEWFKENVKEATDLIRSSYFYGDKKKAYEQLNNLINQ